MELLNEYLNGRIGSLVKMIDSCEEERRSIIREVTMLKSEAGAGGIGGLIEEVCKHVIGILENIAVTVKTNVKNDKDKCEPIKETRQKKCRYFDRGFCKYRENCRYYHSAVTCEDYLQEG